VQKKKDIESFARQLVIAVEAAEADGLTSFRTIANHLNINGITISGEKSWTDKTLANFLNSPDAKRHRLELQTEQAVSLKYFHNDTNKSLTSEQLQKISKTTIGHYNQAAEDFRDGTNDHDVSQNYDALLGAIEPPPPYTILDLGCGPGRDLYYFKSLGHSAIGLDGSKEFVDMAHSYSGCLVLHQEFLAMKLPKSHFDGVFANASLFHVPSQELPRILLELSKTLKSRGILFCSNPRGNNEEGLSDSRYSCFHDLATWRNYVTSAGFKEVEHYFRPQGLPRHKQPWLATVWRKF